MISRIALPSWISSVRIASLTPDRRVNYGSLPMAYLVDERELNDDPTNFWIFSEAGLKRMMRRSGWNILNYATAGIGARRSTVATPESARQWKTPA